MIDSLPLLLQCPFCSALQLVAEADPLCGNCGISLKHARTVLQASVRYPTPATPTATGGADIPAASPVAGGHDHVATTTSGEGLAGQPVPGHGQALDETVVASRYSSPASLRRVWALQLEDGRLFELATTDIIVGRRPTGSDTATPLTITDDTGMLSKSHARLRWEGDTWTIEDLSSMNGVANIDAAGVATELTPGVAVPVSAWIRLGDIVARITAATATS